MSEQVDRLRAIFHGEVQGVGFRYTARAAAAAYPHVTGTVCNLPDGTVELIIEGPAGELNSLVTDIYSAMNSHISDITRDVSVGMRQYSGFSIIF